VIPAGYLLTSPQKREHGGRRRPGRFPYDELVVVLNSKIRQIPPDHTGKHNDDLEVGEISAEGETYEIAIERLRAKVPEGWQMLGIGRD